MTSPLVTAVPFELAANKLQGQITSIQTVLAAGTKTLSTTEKATVTKLSNDATSYGKVQTSIASAQQVITAAKSALTKITSVLQDMQLLANKANDPTLGSSDATVFNQQFQAKILELEKYASKSRTNGVNLLSGTAVLNVTTGIDKKDPKSTTTVYPVNVLAMVSGGVLANAAVDSPKHAQQAIDGIRAAMSAVNNGQQDLSTSAKTLTKLNTTAGKQLTTTNNTLTSMQAIDKTGLSKQLTTLLNEQEADYKIINQLTGSAYTNLNILRP
ncbi:flagellin-like protein [Jezberella montanilacus]|jgi:flagellin-like hook-associated protein FlgL|uniref:Flagellin-like protein n=1 Tax=Jezberella montanilacus TaxID=323426 RepID=A0A2T0XDF1_9BURK|nr:hypothetical protein [Jezberella montanilacus]PRY96920.1 flagellin-like protein [Jezberella montanilacus]